MTAATIHPRCFPQGEHGEHDRRRRNQPLPHALEAIGARATTTAAGLDDEARTIDLAA
ncbi:hypothetical protein [Sorangium sp. So ce341]|uniref:hypothetical protein n=1 Tax=Sorangium sp. So ce341 TaxID=3133302 RepID=UPI003F5E1599